MTVEPKRWQIYLDSRAQYLAVRDFMHKQMYKRLPPHTGCAHVFGSLALLTFLNQLSVQCCLHSRC